MPVTLQVLAAAQGNLIVNPDTFVGVRLHRRAGRYPLQLPSTVLSSGSPVTFNLSTNAAWLSVSANSYVTPASVFINIVPPPGMGVGVYYGTVNVTPNSNSGGAKQINVTLRVNASGSITATPTYLLFNYQPGGPFPQSQLINVSSLTGAPVGFTVSKPQPRGGGTWLSANTGAGATPYSIVISAFPSGLNPGTYFGTVTITPTTNAITATQIPVTLTVSSSTQLIADPSSLTFNYQSGGAFPASQYISVRSTGAPIAFGVSIQGGLPWVTASVFSALTPTGFSVNVQPPPNIPTGTYLASVLLSPTSGGGSAVTIPITIQYRGAELPGLWDGRPRSSPILIGGPNPAPEIVLVTSSGGSIRFDAVPVTTTLTPWLFVTQSSQYTPANLSISVAPVRSSAAGSYSGAVVINADGATNGQQTIDVTLTVTTSSAFLATPFGLVFSYQLDKAAPAPQAFVVSSGSGSVGFAASAETSAGGNWLIVVGRASTPATAAAGVNTSGMSPGTYNGRILIKSTDGSVPELEVPVILNISAAPVFMPAANQVSFQYETTGGTPAPQKVTINSNTSDAIVFYTKVATADGGTWLTAAPDIASTPTDVTLSVNPKGLAPGSYYGLVAFTDPGGDTPTSFSCRCTSRSAADRSSPVPAQTILFNAQAGLGGSSAQTITVKSAGPPTQFRVLTSGGVDWLTASPATGVTDWRGHCGRVVERSRFRLLYLGLVTIDIPGVPNSQQYVPVIFSVAPGFAQ